MDTERQLRESTPHLIWGALALGAFVLAAGSIGVAMISARTERGPQRIPIQRPEPAPLPAMYPAMAEIARLNETVRALAAERDRLAGRVEQVERSLGDITASISKSAVPKSAPASSPAAAADPVERPSLAAQPEFAVDLGAEASIERLRTRWVSLRGSHQTLETLQPLIHVREGAKPGTVELRLVAGPLASAAAAARICAVLAAGRIPCQTTTFDGQRLAQR